MRFGLPPRPVRFLFGSLGASCTLCVGLLGARAIYSGDGRYAFLAWNLVLAAVPLALAAGIQLLCAARGRKLLVAPLALLWLLFFPNAPYVITDFVHLAPAPPVPLWFDVLLFTSYAWTSLSLGLVSLHWLTRLVPARVGAVGRWAAIVALFAASSVAIDLGRFDQRNSWDLFVRPATVFADLGAAGTLPRLIGVTIGFTAFLTVAYATFEALVALGEVEVAAPAEGLRDDVDGRRGRTATSHERDEQRDIHILVERERHGIAPHEAYLE